MVRTLVPGVNGIGELVGDPSVNNPASVRLTVPDVDSSVSESSLVYLTAVPNDPEVWNG